MINRQLLDPQSIVVIGGSNNVHKPGGAIVRNILQGGYQGTLRIVNPKEDEVQGIKVFHDAKELPPTELAVLVIPAKFCPDTVELLAREKETRAFIIISAGFGEETAAGAKLEQRILDACEEYGATFFSNGAAPGAVLEHPGVLKDPEKVRRSWTQTFGGSSNANKIAVLEEGMKYTPISISPNEAQFLETRKFQVDEIARIFRIPPHMIGDLDRSTFSNIEQQSLEFVKYTLDPWVTRWEQSMNRRLIKESDKGKCFFKFNVDGLLRGDYQSRMNGYAVGIQNGFLSVNDVRELENFDLISEEEGGNNYMVNGNLVKLKDVGAAYNTTPKTEEMEESEDE